MLFYEEAKITVIFSYSCLCERKLSCAGFVSLLDSLAELIAVESIS